MKRKLALVALLASSVMGAGACQRRGKRASRNTEKCCKTANPAELF